MTVQPDDVIAITENIMRTMLDCEIQATDVATAIDASAATPEGDAIAYQIDIHGAWKGVVIVESSVELARSMACGMLGVGGETVTDDDLQDALSEITNMVGGNIKSLLTSPSYLSLPRQAGASPMGTDALPAESGAEQTAPLTMLSQTTFLCHEQPLRITVCQQ